MLLKNIASKKHIILYYKINLINKQLKIYHMKRFFNEEEIPLTIGELLEKYPIDEFLSPYRSTVNMLSFITSKQFELVLVDKGIDIETAKLYFEFRVPVQQGRGNQSHTDMMIFDKNKCIAIEAKNTEPKYPKVHKWEGCSDNKLEVLNGWLNLINSKLTNKIKIEDIQDITYQMIHRLASACINETKKPEMIYLYFDNKKEMINYYKEQLNKLKLLVKDNIKIELFSISSIPTAEMKDLQKQWGEGTRDLRDKVMDGLIKNSLYTFENTKLKSIL